MFKSGDNTYGYGLVVDHTPKGLRVVVGDNLSANAITINPEEALKLYNYLGEVYGKGTTETSKDKVNSKETVSKPSEKGGNDEGNKSLPKTPK